MLLQQQLKLRELQQKLAQLQRLPPQQAGVGRDELLRYIQHVTSRVEAIDQELRAAASRPSSPMPPGYGPQRCASPQRCPSPGACYRYDSPARSQTPPRTDVAHVLGMVQPRAPPGTLGALRTAQGSVLLSPGASVSVANGAPFSTRGPRLGSPAGSPRLATERGSVGSGNIPGRTGDLRKSLSDKRPPAPKSDSHLSEDCVKFQKRLGGMRMSAKAVRNL